MLRSLRRDGVRVSADAGLSWQQAEQGRERGDSRPFARSGESCARAQSARDSRRPARRSPVHSARRGRIGLRMCRLPQAASQYRFNSGHRDFVSFQWASRVPRAVNLACTGKNPLFRLSHVWTRIRCSKQHLRAFQKEAIVTRFDQPHGLPEKRSSMQAAISFRRACPTASAFRRAAA